MDLLTFLNCCEFGIEMKFFGLLVLKGQKAIMRKVFLILPCITCDSLKVEF